ncbi:hypothetical protein E2I00_009812 [Balaenoptera physalus]|uniref:SH3 domain-containing protein n=1 Tax=Balaenoptera physalus TaxID=9770 RepID=A0A643C9K1_BALPH|nr:hypothetical protein E2I00_009812 [Balaenoptera physalus]
MEKKVDVTSKAVTEVLARTIEYLQPNPEVKQNFIDPLQNLCDKDLKEIQEAARDGGQTEGSSSALAGPLQIEQVSQLSALVDAQLDYHRQAVQILDELADKLKRRSPKDGHQAPRQHSQPTSVLCLQAASSSFRSSDKPTRTPSSRSMPPLDQPSCKALYDFEPENDGELGFHEGDIITLTNQIDENWYEGMLHGQSGFFPLSYVEVLVPLPQ